MSVGSSCHRIENYLELLPFLIDLQNDFMFTSIDSCKHSVGNQCPIVIGDMVTLL